MRDFKERLSTRTILAPVEGHKGPVSGAHQHPSNAVKARSHSAPPTHTPPL